MADYQSHFAEWGNCSSEKLNHLARLPQVGTKHLTRAQEIFADRQNWNYQAIEDLQFLGNAEPRGVQLCGEGGLSIKVTPLGWEKELG